LPNCELNLSENKRARKFVNHVKNELSRYGMKLVFGAGEHVNCEGLRLSGYFDELKGIIKVARRNNYWLTVLAHEYAHFLQWKYQTREYMDISVNKKDALYIIDDWMKGGEYRPSTIRKAFLKARNLEKKCEMKALAVIRRFNLPIKEEFFIRQANCHIYYYHMMEKTRRLRGFEDMFFNRRIQRLIPKSFTCKNIRHMPSKVYEVVKTEI